MIDFEMFPRTNGRHVKWYCILVAAVMLLGACNRDASASNSADSPVIAQSLKRADLMRAVFPGWQDKQEGNGRVFDVDVPDRDDKGNFSRDLVSSRLDIRPREVIKLDDTHAVMLTEGVEVTDDGERVDSHASGAWLGAYFFRAEGTGWTLERRDDGVDYDGFEGSYGDSHVVKLASGEFGLLLETGSCWQGYCGSWVSVYGISPAHIDNLARSIKVSATNRGSSDECSDVLTHGDASETSRSPNAGGDYASAEGTPQCFDVNGNIAVDQGTNGPGDLRITFGGFETVADKQGASIRRVRDVAVYRMKDGKYQLVEGRNPVPSF